MCKYGYYDEDHGMTDLLRVVWRMSVLIFLHLRSMFRSLDVERWARNICSDWYSRDRVLWRLHYHLLLRSSSYQGWPHACIAIVSASLLNRWSMNRSMYRASGCCFECSAWRSWSVSSSVRMIVWVNAEAWNCIHNRLRWSTLLCRCVREGRKDLW